MNGRPVRLLSSLALGLLLVLSALPAQAGTQVELILDASGSMYNKLDDGRYRITAAKEVLSNFVLNLPEDDLDVGLRIYGSELQPAEPGACQDSKLAVPVDGVQRDAMLQAIKDTRARGKTPIAYSLEQALGDFKKDGACLIVLVTDGEEVCGGDLKASAAKLEQAGCEVDLRIIGFDLTPEAQASFEGIGTFENAADAASLAGALDRAVENVVVKEPIGEATLTAPDSVVAGTSFDIQWTGPDGPRDYITIVEKSAMDGNYGAYVYTKDGSPVTLYAPATPGEYEVRYQSDRVEGVAARRTVNVTEAEFAIGGPSAIPAGQAFEIPWSGPDGERDYITIVEASAPDGRYGSYKYTKEGSPLRLHAPIKAGDYELRYQSDRVSGVFYRRPITVEPVDVTLDVPATVTAGKTFEVAWTGPNGDRDYVTVVEAAKPDGNYGQYVYTEKGSPITLTAPYAEGDYEVRYQSDRESGVFARVSLTIERQPIVLDAPASVAANSEFQVTWQGPDGQGDYVTIVEKGAKPGAYASYRYTNTGSTLTLRAPEKPGDYELRYQSDRERGIVFGSRSIRVE